MIVADLVEASNKQSNPADYLISTLLSTGCWINRCCLYSFWIMLSLHHVSDTYFFVCMFHVFCTICTLYFLLSVPLQLSSSILLLIFCLPLSSSFPLESLLVPPLSDLLSFCLSSHPLSHSFSHLNLSLSLRLLLILSLFCLSSHILSISLCPSSCLSHFRLLSPV